MLELKAILKRKLPWKKKRRVSFVPVPAATSRRSWFSDYMNNKSEIGLHSHSQDSDREMERFEGSVPGGPTALITARSMKLPIVFSVM